MQDTNVQENDHKERSIETCQVAGDNLFKTAWK